MWERKDWPKGDDGVRRMRRMMSMAWCVALGVAFGGQDMTLPLTVDTGFFERANEPVSVTLTLPRTADLRSGVLRRRGNPQSLPFWFEPAGPGKGTLNWILTGKTESLTRVQFELHFDVGQWCETACGDESVRKMAAEWDNLLPNGGFETIRTSDVTHTSTWKGKVLPDGWQLNDFAWRYRALPDLSACCRISSIETHRGRHSLMFVNEPKEEPVEGAETRKVTVAGFANGPFFPLRPGRTVRFSYWVKFTDLSQDGYISASVNFLDADKKRVHPKNYAINRLQAAYGTQRNLREDYFGKWVCVSVSRRPPPGVRFGQVSISGSFHGTVFVDDLRIRVARSGDPPIITTGAIGPGIRQGGQ